ncbi:pyruvate kinase [Pseudobutyrivibrio xylanivorans]|uniref:Pyruvate kinase n=1 Tax=Pseudobutyrivibrio xylanivorans DSM 14809 TaxID=1123012 RepID=A0A1M6KLA6_PSEXY|nr:pyruvate kinase [Pseudobutyrivibrio xylanivorans]SHJ59631.1 pyruvate kinase [Pseudobutyrivibrio xylanivorans DSM 14809]
MIDVLGTLGPSCSDEKILEAMFSEGMTGIRINLSHVMLRECREQIKAIKSAAAKIGIDAKILIDMQGPELRIGEMKKPISLKEGQEIKLGNGEIPVEPIILENIRNGMDILLDDGKILVNVNEVADKYACAVVKRGGVLSSKKSILLVGTTINMPAVTEKDLENISIAQELGITGVMQPFVRSRDDLMDVRHALENCGAKDIKIYAKIENIDGVNSLESFMDACDEIVIARGDLGNCMPLWKLPRVQKQISLVCNKYKKPFMVVTQMLSSMEHSKVPTRAEVSDIYNAALDGAKSVMVTGETAVGEYPVEVIRYLRKTVNECHTRIIDENISLVPYYRNDEVSLPWYQDIDVCKQVDNIDFVYDHNRLRTMYDYLDAHGSLYYISYKGTLIGDVSLCDNGELAIVICKEYQNKHIGRACIMDMIELAREKGMEKVKAKIYSFNTQSLRMVQSLGFEKVAGEWYEYEYVIK